MSIPVSAAEQLRLPFSPDRDAVRAYLEKVSGRELHLILTDNTSSMLSVKRSGRKATVRMQRFFLGAGREVLDEMGRFISGKNGPCPSLRAYIRSMSVSLGRKPARRMPCRTKGERYDLLEIFEKINRRYFGGRIACTITWGLRQSRRCVRRKTLGSYTRESNTIRISPSLDRRGVPRYFIEFVVYHEMLHADIGTEKKEGRRSIHSREFRKRERLFVDYDRAMAWERKG